MRRLAGLVAAVLLVTVLIAFCGILTAPLLLILAADLTVGVLLVRSAAEPPPPARRQTSAP